MPSSHLRRLGSDAAVYGLAVALSRALAIMLVPVYTRVFAPAEYGVVALITACTTLLSMFLAGLDNAAARWFYESTEPKSRDRVVATWFWYQVVAGLLLLATVAVARHWLASALTGAGTAALLVLATGTLCLQTPGKVLSGVLRFERRAMIMAAFTVCTATVNVVAIVCALWFWRLGLPGLYWAQFSAALLSAAAALVLIARRVAPGLLERNTSRSMLTFGLPVIPAAIASWATSSSDRFFLQHFASSADVGIYAIAVTLASLLLVADSAFQMAWGPHAYSLKDSEGARDVYAHVFGAYALAACAAVTGLSLFAPAVLAVFATPAYAPAADIVPIIAFANMAVGLSGTAGIGAGLVKQSRPLAISLAIGALASVACNLVLVSRFGRTGAALAMLIGYGLAWAYLHAASQRLYPIPYRLDRLALAVGVACVIIVVDRLVLPPLQWWAHVCRVLLLAAFVPVSVAVGVVPFGRLREAFGLARGRSTELRP